MVEEDEGSKGRIGEEGVLVFDDKEEELERSRIVREITNEML